MKFKYVFVAILFFFSCSPKNPPTQLPAVAADSSSLPRIQEQQDFIDRQGEAIVLAKHIIDSLLIDNYKLHSRIDALQLKYDSVNGLRFVDGYKVNRIRYYLRIIDRNPSQRKFLLSWVRRAVE